MRLTPADIDEARDMFRAGKSRQEIAEWFGISYASACRIVKGMPERSRRGRPRMSEAGVADYAIHFRVPPETREALETIARAELVRVSDLVREAISTVIAKHKISENRDTKSGASLGAVPQMERI